MGFSITGATMSAEAARELLLFNFDFLPHNIIGHAIIDIECDQLQDRIRKQLGDFVYPDDYIADDNDGIKPIILGG